MKKKFLLALFAKSGVKLTPELQAVVDAATDTEVIDVPDALLEQGVNGVLSVRDAATHPDVLNALKGKLYSVTDNAARQAMLDEGFTEDEIKATLEGKGPDAKITAAAKAIKEKTGKPVEEVTKDLKTALNTEKAQRAKDKETFDQTVKELNDKFSTFQRNAAIENLLNNGDFKIKTGGLPKDKVLKLVKDDLQDFAKTNGIELKLDEAGKISIVNTKEANADFYLNQVKVEGFEPVLQHVLKAGGYLEDASGQPTHQTYQADPGQYSVEGAGTKQSVMNANFAGFPPVS